MDATFHSTNPDIVFGASQNGSIHVTYDGAQSYDFNISNPARDNGATGGWVTPFEGTATEPFKMYVGFQNMWEYDADTEQWTQLSDFGSGQTAREVALCPTNPDALALLKTGSTAGSRQIWLTKDHGANWDKISDNTNIFGFAYASDICFGNSDNELYLALAGYTNNHRIYRTMDGGQTWENITKGFPKIPVITIEHHTHSLNNMVYIGTDDGVYYTNDDLDEWVPYFDGLPVVRVSDMELHYASNKVYIATYGRGMWANDLIPTPLVSTETPKPLQATLKVVPNPSAGSGMIYLNELQAGRFQLRIVDVLGREVWQQSMENVGTQMALPVPSGLISGLYYLQLQQGKNTRTVTFLIEK